MSDGNPEKECPRCGGTCVVKNGFREGRQQRRCRSPECWLQFMDRPEAFRQRFPAEVIAKAIELRLEAMSYEKIAADVGRRFFTPPTKIPAATVLRWIEKYLALAAEEVRKLTVKVYGPLSVEYASLRPAEGGCWLVRDLSTSYVLSARAAVSFDAAVVREMMLESIRPIGELDGELFNFTFGIEEDAGGLEDYSGILEAIKQLPYPFGRFIRPEEMEPDYILLLGAGGPFREPLRAMRKRRIFRSPESRQRFLDGWVVRHNFFKVRRGPGGRTPASWAEVAVPFGSWLDVVNHRVKVAKEGPRQREGRRGDRRRQVDSGNAI